MTKLLSDLEKVIQLVDSTTLGKFLNKKKSLITYEILDLCDKRRVLYGFYMG